MATSPTRTVTSIVASIGNIWPNTPEHKLAQQLAEVIPTTLATLARQTPDGWPTTTNRTRHSNSISDPTAQQAIRRQPAVEQRTLITTNLARIRYTVQIRHRQATLELLQNTIGMCYQSYGPIDPKTKAALMCSTIHPDDKGIEPWIDPLCSRISDVGRAGLCEACYRRRLRALANRPE